MDEYSALATHQSSTFPFPYIGVASLAGRPFLFIFNMRNGQKIDHFRGAGRDIRLKQLWSMAAYGAGAIGGGVPLHDKFHN